MHGGEHWSSLHGRCAEGQIVLLSQPAHRQRYLLCSGGLRRVHAPGDEQSRGGSGIQPAICNDNRFNHVDTFYKNLFKQHSCEALVSIVKGLRSRMSDRKTKSSRAEATMKRAKDILHGELSVALDIDVKDVEGYIASRLGAEE